jgi:hypothetical protein
MFVWVKVISELSSPKRLFVPEINASVFFQRSLFPIVPFEKFIALLVLIVLK